MPRPYQLKERADSQDQTRQRIIEAAIELHQTIGPAASTMSDIARRAGVGRVTVYRHFPDELALARSCSGLYFQRHPLPNPKKWQTIPDPADRMRAGLRDAYTFFSTTEAMLGHVLADARDHPVMKPYHALWNHATGVLLSPWPARGNRRKLLRAVIALALTFETWRTLVREEHLTHDQAIEIALQSALVFGSKP